MYRIVSAERCRGNLDEAFSVVRGPSLSSLAILTELVVNEIVWSIGTYCLEAVRTKLKGNDTIDVAL